MRTNRDRYARFGPFCLDLSSEELFGEGRRVPLPPQASKLLRALVSSPGELVSREEIQRALWTDDTFVDFEHGINKCIKQLRAALRDDAEKPTYIQTVSRKGYRFLARVEVEGNGPSEPERSPYPGLSSFSETDAPFFFGREAEVEALWAKLERRRLVALIGPSGAGKSSFLRAGLCPSRPSAWRVAFLSPGNAPSVALSRAMLAATSEAGRSTRTLVVMDAFEELFTSNPKEVQKEFAETIGCLVSDQEPRVHVLLSMRDDFLFRCHEHERLSPAFFDVTPFGPPRGSALRRALVEPARLCGYEFESEQLIATMLAEVENERGALPLLAFAAARLWEHRDRERKLLTRKAFEENGRVGGALAKHAEGVLGASGAKTLPLARELFRNLVTTEGTRASRNLDELLSIFPTADERLAAEAVLRELVAARLLTSYEAKADSNERRVEIIHESLLRAWPRLVRWRTQDADGAQLRDQLRQAARLWEERGRPRDLLWTGSSYRELSDWRERHKAGLTATEQSFAGAAARLDGRRRRRRKIGLGALLAVSFAGIAVVTSLWRDAEQAAIRAEASKLLALAEARLQQDPTEALAFATASLELTDTGDARVFVMKALWEAPPAIELIVDSQAARSPSFSPDGTWLAAAGHSTEALVWSEKGGDPIVLPGHQTSPRGSNLARWASNDLLVTGSYRMVGSRVHLWSLPGGERVRTIDFGKPSSWQVGEGLLVAESLETGSATDPEAEVLRSWTLPTGDPVFLGAIDGKKLRTPQPYTGKGPDSDRVHHGGVWSLTRAGSAGENALQRADSQSSSPANDPSQVHVWNLRAWPDARPLALRRNGSWYGAVSRLHPKGDWLVASTASFTRLTFWPLAERYPSVVDGYRTALRPLAFSPDGKWLATSWGRGELRLWPLPGSGTREVRTWSLPDPSLVSSIVFDGKGRFLFVTGNQDRAWIVPLDRSPAQKLRGFSEDTLLAAGAIAPSSRFVATAFWYGEGKKTLRVWNLETGALRDFDLPHVASSEPSTGYSEGIARLSFVNDATLYTAGDGGLRRWDLESGSSELVTAAPPGFGMRAALNAEKGVAITYETRWGLWRDCPKSRLHDLRTGASQELTHFGECSAWSLDAVALDASGTVAATGGLDGIVRVGRLSAREPHLLIGHGGAIDDIAISPDLRWIATTGQDDTIRLWPMPDLSKPPLHTLPHDQLLAKLRSLTNLRVARDRSSPTGWQVEVGRFPGWKQVPTW